MISVRRAIAPLLTALLLADAGQVAAQPFRPSLSFCNRTLRPLVTAIAYDLVGTVRQTTTGWQRVQACTCRTLLQGRPLRATEVFVMAQRDGVNLLSGARPGLCVRSTAFTFERENGDAAACAAAGGRPGLFKWYDTRGGTKRVNLRRQGECNLMGDQ